MITFFSYIVHTIVLTLQFGVIMHFINIKTLSRSPSKYIKLANEKDDIIITRNGHPYAILTKIDDEDLEDYIIAKHYNLEKEFTVAKKEHESGKTKNVRELLETVE